ncbi:hypothetical protein BRD04_09440 [Halobacteriales archaeon QS_9_67_17]|nr:MAG: hypothetical protein BRD04_09440 [Halobacteriales archaeon QS_9_67_17]
MDEGADRLRIRWTMLVPIVRTASPFLGWHSGGEARAPLAPPRPQYRSCRSDSLLCLKRVQDIDSVEHRDDHVGVHVLELLGAQVETQWLYVAVLLDIELLVAVEVKLSFNVHAHVAEHFTAILAQIERFMIPICHWPIIVG